MAITETELRLIAALNESKGLSGLRVDLLKLLIEKFPATVQEKGQALLERLNVDLVKQKVHLEELLASLPKGDIRRGQAIFNSPKTACASCHKDVYSKHIFTEHHLTSALASEISNLGSFAPEKNLFPFGPVTNVARL